MSNIPKLINENTIIIGDLHLFDEAVMRSCRPQFQSLADHDNYVIELLEYIAKFQQNDNIYTSLLINGDLFGSSFDLDNRLYGEYHNDIIKRFNDLPFDTKILCRGNHDTSSTKSYIEIMGFDAVYDYPIIVDDFFIISHEPYFVNDHSPFANIYAHVHNDPRYKTISKQTFCSSFERIPEKSILTESVLYALPTFRNIKYAMKTAATIDSGWICK